MTFAATWQRIESLAGETFYLLGGKTFTYEVTEKGLQPSDNEQTIPRSEFERAFALGTVPHPRALKSLGFDHVDNLFSILTDPRVRG